MSRENIFGYPFNLKWGLRYPLNSKTGKRTRPDLMPVSNHTLKVWFGIDPKTNSPSKVLTKKHPLNSSMSLVFGRNFRKWPTRNNVEANKRSRAATRIQRVFRSSKKYPVVYTSVRNAKILSKMVGFIPLNKKAFYMVE
jgi:hypothetical protein